MPTSQNNIKAEYCNELRPPYAAHEIKADRQHISNDWELRTCNHSDALNDNSGYDGLFQPILQEEKYQNTAAGESKIGNQTIDSQLLLHVAVHLQNCSMVATLLKHKAAGVEERDRYGRTALHIAVFLGNETLVSLLLQHGADIRSCDSYGQSPLYFAAVGGQNNILELLLEPERSKFIQS
jgi:ankyrin repeat protein